MTRPDSIQKLLLVVVIFLGVLLLGPYLGINLLSGPSADKVPAALSIDSDQYAEESDESESTDLEPLDPSELKKLNLDQAEGAGKVPGNRDGITEIEQLLEDR